RLQSRGQRVHRVHAQHQLGRRVHRYGSDVTVRRQSGAAVQRAHAGGGHRSRGPGSLARDGRRQASWYWRALRGAPCARRVGAQQVFRKATRGMMKRTALVGAAFAATTLAAGPALALDRIPVAVVWMGDAASVEEGGAARTVADVNAQLAKTQTARPIDGVEDRKTLVE